MQTKATNNLQYLRNIGIIAHIDAGKTTITERILFYTGKNYKIGEVHDGKTVTDYMVQERERGITIVSAAVSCSWFYKENKDSTPYTINIIDTPGHVDFTIEVERSLRVLDGAIIVFDGVAGVESQSETVWQQANKYSIPRICFVNKLDRLGANFFYCLEDIQKKFSAKTVVLSLPIGKESQFQGVVDIVNMKSIIYQNVSYGSKYSISDIPEELYNISQQYRNDLIDKCIDCSDSFAEKYLDEEKISNTDIIHAIRLGTLKNDIVPICCGSAFKNKGVQFLLDSVIDFMPSPKDIGNIKGIDYNGCKILRKPDVNDFFSALVFKIILDKFGLLAYTRVYSGICNKGSYILNVRTRNKVRISRLVQLFADKKQDISSMQAGDIVAVIGIDARTGDSLAELEHPIVLESMTIPPSVIEFSIEAESKKQQEHLSIALDKICKEDPSVRLIIDKETNQTKIAGMGELHLEIVVDRLKREYFLDVQVGKPQVAYKETIKKESTMEGKYIKQTGGRGQYGHVFLRVSPHEKSLFTFVNKIVGGSVPKEYIPAIKKGVQESLSSGVKAGYPIINISVALLNGSYHDVDSSEMAFKIAASMAFKKCMNNAEPFILEPIMKTEVVTPEQFIGDILSDISSRRGQIIDIEDKNNIKCVTCLVPLANMFGFSNDLRSRTQGRANYTMEFDGYKAVTKVIEEKIVNRNKL